MIFYNVYECGDDENPTKDVDTSAAGANVIIADGSVNTINGSYVAKIYEPDSVVLNDRKTKVKDADKLHKYDGAFYSRRSMNIFGGLENTGILNICAENEGLDSELHFNSQAAVFGQSVKEMSKLLDFQGAGTLENLSVGLGDLYVTVYGGRTRLGSGVTPLGSVLKGSASGQFPLNLSYTLVKFFDGSNDGLVSESSFPWGERFTLVTPKGKRGISHGDMIDLNRENIPGFDVREFYVELVKELKDRGL